MFTADQNDKICIVRSAFLGDWVVIVPFVTYLLFECGVKKENISFLIINNQGSNPTPIIMGPDSRLAINSFVLHSGSSVRLIRSALELRKNKQLRQTNKVVHLPFTHDDKSSVRKKRLVSKLIFASSTEFHGFISAPHNMESQYLSYFHKLGLDWTFRRDYVDALLKEEGICLSQPKSGEMKIAIYANSKLTMKIWPAGNYVAVINELSSRFRAKFFLIGGKEDIAYNDEILRQINNADITNIAGSLRIPQLISFLGSVDLLIGNDGAPLHFAALANTPIVGLYTYKEPVGAWEPLLTERFRTFRTDVACKHCRRQVCGNPVCLTTVTPDTVISAATEMLDGVPKSKAATVLLNNYSYLDCDA